MSDEAKKNVLKGLISWSSKMKREKLKKKAGKKSELDEPDEKDLPGEDAIPGEEEPEGEDIMAKLMAALKAKKE